MNQKHLNNILITGVSSGIGNALAAAYLRRGANVWGVSRRTPVDLAAADQFHFIGADLTEHEASYQAITARLADLDHLNLAVLNAGELGEFGDMADAKLDDLRRLMEINLWANKTVLDALFALDVPIKQVVTVSSGASVNGNRGWRGYALSKAALNMLTKLYAAERPETHFCAIAPGLVDTAMQAAIAELAPDHRFPSLDTLRAKRNTTEMPTPAVIAEKLITAFGQIPDLVESGEFTDIRKMEIE